MSENRDFAWLRKTLCDEIDAVRAGTADHNRAKAVTGLALVALKSVEVESALRQQEIELAGKNAAKVGSLPLCEVAAPALESGSDAVGAPARRSGEEKGSAPPPPVASPAPAPPAPPAPAPEITEVGGFKVGDRVTCPNGKGGTIKSVRTSGRIEVTEDGGGTFPYTARHLRPEGSAAQPRPAPIKSPIVPPGPVPRFVAGRNSSGSR